MERLEIVIYFIIILTFVSNFRLFQEDKGDFFQEDGHFRDTGPEEQIRVKTPLTPCKYHAKAHLPQPEF